MTKGGFCRDPRLLRGSCCLSTAFHRTLVMSIIYTRPNIFYVRPISPTLSPTYTRPWLPDQRGLHVILSAPLSLSIVSPNSGQKDSPPPAPSLLRLDMLLSPSSRTRGRFYVQYMGPALGLAKRNQTRLRLHVEAVGSLKTTSLCDANRTVTSTLIFIFIFIL